MNAVANGNGTAGSGKIRFGRLVAYSTRPDSSHAAEAIDMRYTYEIADAPTGTQLTITVESKIQSPLVKTVIWMRGGGFLDAYLRQIGHLLGEDITPTGI